MQKKLDRNPIFFISHFITVLFYTFPGVVLKVMRYFVILLVYKNEIFLLFQIIIFSSVLNVWSRKYICKARHYEFIGNDMLYLRSMDKTPMTWLWHGIFQKKFGMVFISKQCYGAYMLNMSWTKDQDVPGKNGRDMEPIFKLVFQNTFKGFYF